MPPTSTCRARLPRPWRSRLSAWYCSGLRYRWQGSARDSRHCLALIPIVVPAVESQADQPAHDAHNQGTEHRGDEAVNVEWHAQLVRDPAGEPEQQAVDHDADQSEGDRVCQAADRLNDWLQHGVDDAEDKRDHDKRGDLARSGMRVQMDAGDQDCGKPYGDRRDHELDQNPHCVTPLARRSRPGVVSLLDRISIDRTDRTEPALADKSSGDERPPASASCWAGFRAGLADRMMAASSAGIGGYLESGHGGVGHRGSPQRGWGSGDPQCWAGCCLMQVIRRCSKAGTGTITGHGTASRLWLFVVHHQPRAP